MNKDFIPADAPGDGLMASKAEVAKVQSWVQEVFGTSSRSENDSIRIQVNYQQYNTLHYRQSCMGTDIKIGSREFEHGLGTHAKSEILVHLPVGAKRFKAFVGIDNNYDTMGIHGSASFSVSAGGTELAATGALKGGDKPHPIDVELPEGTRELLLKVDPTVDGAAYDQSDWADACVVMSDGGIRYLDEVSSRDLLSDNRMPFSFKYNGVPSSDFIGKWKRSVDKRDESDRVRYITTWTDPESGLAVTADVAAFKEYAAVDWLLRFENRGDKDTPIIEDIQTVDLGLPTHQTGTPVVLHELHGDSCSDLSFQPFDESIDAGKSLTIAPTNGRPSQVTAFPFWNLQYEDRGIITAIGWSGQWAAMFDRDEGGSTRFRSGMEKTHLLLHPGEKIRTPRVLMMQWNGDRQRAQVAFRRLMLFKYVPKLDGKPLQYPICIQAFDRYMRLPEWPTEAGQIHNIEVGHEIGCDNHWFDAGWFEGDFPAGVGNWYCKPKEFPNGLKPLGDKCKQLGMGFILWFEPCRVGPKTQIYREHPQWVLGGGDRRLYNLGDPDALRWMTDLLSKRISEFGITGYREDYNIDPLYLWRNNDTPDRQGMTEIRFVEGHYAMWDELRAKHPGLWIDNCASGGRRIDLETCMRSIPLWRSDTSCSPGHLDANQMQTVALSQYVPLNSGAAWDPDTYSFRSNATSGVIAEIGYLDPKFPKAAVKSIIDEVKENRKYWYGDLYPLTPLTSSPDDFFAYQLHRADLDEGMVIGFRRSKNELLGIVVTLHGLKPNTKYSLEFIDGKHGKTIKRMTGSEMEKSGVTLRIPEKADSLVVRYKPITSKD